MQEQSPYGNYYAILLEQLRKTVRLLVLVLVLTQPFGDYMKLDFCHNIMLR